MSIKRIGGSPWTPEMDRRLTTMVADMASTGTVFGEIAAILGVTRNAAIGRHNRIKQNIKLGRVATVMIVAVPQKIECNIFDIRNNQCKFPLFGPERLPVEQRMFCGERSASGHYCAKHASIVYTPYVKGREFVRKFV